MLDNTAELCYAKELFRNLKYKIIPKNRQLPGFDLPWLTFIWFKLCELWGNNITVIYCVLILQKGDAQQTVIILGNTNSNTKSKISNIYYVLLPFVSPLLYSNHIKTSHIKRTFLPGEKTKVDMGAGTGVEFDFQDFFWYREYDM